MRILLTAGPTREPIDPVRYIGNRSSGRMGAALAQAALRAGHEVTLIVGPVSVSMPGEARRIDVETAAQMHEAVLQEFAGHQALIMAAAVADYRPVNLSAQKIGREGTLTLLCEATADIVADAGRIKGADQRTVGFSLEAQGDLHRARAKLLAKNLDLIVYNSIATMNSDTIEPTLLWRDGRTKALPTGSKLQFAQNLLEAVERLYSS